MSEATDSSVDRWAAGDRYEAYMGRWSRLAAREFVEWLAPARAGHWLEVGCGTGALTVSVCGSCEPESVVACDPSAAFVEHMRAELQQPRLQCVCTGADALPQRQNGFDLIVSGLVLNFLPQPAVALAAMRERLRPEGEVAAYVWDYAGGVEFLRHFWEQAVVADAGAAALDEAVRFATWQMSHLRSLFAAAGLVAVESRTLTVATSFASFDDFWQPFLGGTGPAPTYVASLTKPQRDSLADRLRASVPIATDGSIRLEARALAVRGRRPQ